MAQKPYADGVPVYVARGWDGMIPIRKGSKIPAMSDVTGYSGRQVTGDEALELSKKKQYSYCNLGLRLPRGIVGVDVDDYGDKSGLATLTRLSNELGELPATPYSTARGQGVSGIRFFRVPEDLDFEPVFGDDIECIRFAHRFAVAWPSIHPKTGTEYRWYDEVGNLLDQPPKPEDFAELPASWIERFGHEPREKKERIGDFYGIEQFLNANDSGDKHGYLEAAKRIFDSSGGSRHDSMLKALGCAMRDAAAGLYPARGAVEQLHELWTDATDGEDREAEFNALVERAAEDAATEEVDPYRRALVNPTETVSFSDNDSSDIVIFERRAVKEAMELAESLPESYTEEWTPDLSQVFDVVRYQGKNVTVFLYEDASQDRQTFDMAVAFAQELSSLDATVKFVSSPRDVYRTVTALPEEMRVTRLRQMIEAATEAPSKAKPRNNKKRDAASGEDPDAKYREENQKRIESELQGGKRRLIELTGDRKLDNDDIISGVKARWDGRKIFNYGNAISRVHSDQVLPQDKAMWMNTLVEACKFVERGKKDMLKNVDPPAYCVTSTLSRYDDFTELLGIRHAPFIRVDGTVCQAPGYDPESKMKLFLSEDLSGIEVPEEPTQEQVVEARKVLEDWLYDFFQIMPTETDRANALGLVLTPFIRGSVPVVPLCIVNGLQHGVGKNKFANGISILYTGKDLVPKTFTAEEEEQRKAMMSIFRDGEDLVCYDEAHHIDGKALAQALTAQTWSDRLLGVSQIAEYPNNATWMSLGNNVRVEGDCIRRVYQIQLKPTTPNPENRTSSDFKHPEFESWTKEIRKELLVAVLTVIRGWYVAGKPRASKDPSFGSFESWEALVRGILEYAGVRGFLDNQQEVKGESSADFGFWVAHLDWLFDAFGDEEFTAREVQLKMVNDPLSEPPPGLEDTSPKDYNRKLGIQYTRMKDRFVGPFRLTRSGEKSRRGLLWSVEKTDD